MENVTWELGCTQKRTNKEKNMGKKCILMSERTNAYSPVLKIVQGTEKILEVVCF